MPKGRITIKFPLIVLQVKGVSGQDVSEAERIVFQGRLQAPLGGLMHRDCLGIRGFMAMGAAHSEGGCAQQEERSSHQPDHVISIVCRMR